MAEEIIEQPNKSVIPLPNNLPYVVAIVLMMLIAFTAIVIMGIVRPEKDNTNTITLILGFLAPTTLSLLAFMKAQETHLSVNSRLDGFMQSARSAAHSQGVIEGRDQGQVEANKRTDDLKKKGK